jgi:predicted  nucleic acid-binding Zn-ribbon protein
MPHQCLNCGRIIKRGSNEILKGCKECSGKKFMYVDQPLSAEKREDLKRKADSVRDEMLRKADPELLEVLKQRGIGNIGDTEVEIDETLGDDWVRVRPSKKGKVEITEGKAESGVEIVPPDGERRSARDLINQFDMELESKKKGPEPEEVQVKPPRKKGKVKKKKEVREVPRARSRKRTRKEKEAVGVINIVEQGVYEIDVEKLLEDNPIVIQKDGSYLIHLPSIFKEGREKNLKKEL